jgi:AraC-like DNA-binding protein
VNLTLVARAAAMGRFTLSHSFSHMLGVPFNKYLQRVRVVHAMRLLAATDQPVAHIAEAVGFTGLSRFNLVFRRITGVTPTAMRRQRRTVESDARASAARPEAYAKNAH